MVTVEDRSGWAMKCSPCTPDGRVESASRFGHPGGGPRRRRNLRRFGLLLVGTPIALVLLAIVVDVSDDDEDDREHEARAPICPYCGVTALPGDLSHVIDTRFVCENPDCETFGEEV